MGIVYLSMTIDFTVAGCYGHHIYFCSYRDVELIFRVCSQNGELIECQANEAQNFGIGQIIFYVTVYSAKISLLFLNRRMVAFTSGWWRRALWLLLGILIACLLFSSFSALFTCIPVSTHFSLIKLGTTDPSKLKCADQAVQNNFQYAGRAFHISTDLLLLIFPLTVIWSLEMALRKKLSLGFAFCFGLICTLASIMRIVVYQKPTNDFTCKFRRLADISSTKLRTLVDSSTLVLWDTIDATFACIVASMPVYYRIVDFAVVSVHSKLNFLFARSEKSHKRVKNSPHARGRTDTDDQKSSVNCDTCQGDRDDSFGSSQKVNRESLQESRESVSQHQNRYDGKYSDDIELISKPRKSPELTLYTN